MAKLYIKNRYGQIPNHILNDKDLSMKAKGLFGYMQSKPEGWDFSVEKIATQTSEGKDSISSGLKELEDKGYLERKKYQNKRGHRETLYILREVPLTGFPSSDKPEIKKERISKNILNSIHTLNEKFRTEVTSDFSKLDKNKEDVYIGKLQEHFEIDYNKLKTSNFPKKTYEICCFIVDISNILEIEPIYNNRTINKFGYLLFDKFSPIHGFSIYDVIDYINDKADYEYSDTEELISSCSGFM